MKEIQRPSNDILQWILANLEYDPSRGLIEKATKMLVHTQKMRICGERVRAKHIAWYLYTGEWQSAIRAIDGDQSNVAVSNLSNRNTNGPMRQSARNIAAQPESPVKVKPEPLVSLTFSEGVWHLKGPGVNAEFKRFKSAMSALTDLYYTCAKLEDKPM